MSDNNLSGNVIRLTRRLKTKKTMFNHSGSENQGARIIAITSGKGGVGKTNIVANIGYALCKAGQRVLIFDADLGLGNLDVLLGLTPRYNLSHVVRGKKTLNEVIVNGPGNMKILPASSGVQELTKLNRTQKIGILNELNNLVSSFDVVLIDTAAGISSNVLYFNASANEIMVVVTPEPTSITDAYALIKVLSVKYREKHFKLLVNFAASTKEADETSRQLSLVAERFLDVSIEYFGHILLDENVKKGVRKQMVVSQMAPMTQASRNFAEIAHRLTRTDADFVRPESNSFLLKELFC